MSDEEKIVPEVSHESAGHEDAEALSPATVDFSAVARVASASALRHVRLISCDAERPLPVEAFEDDWASKAYTGFRSGATPLQEGNWFVAAVGFICHYKPGWDGADGMPDVDEDDPPALHLEVAFELAYDLAEGAELEERDLHHFAYANGTHNAWPYWRELAQSMTVRMGLEPLVIGPFKVPSTFDPD